MLRIVVALGVLVAMGGCQSYEQEWLQSQQQLQAAEARIAGLRKEVEVRDEAIAARDQAIAVRDAAISERDTVIRENCVARSDSDN